MDFLQTQRPSPTPPLQATVTLLLPSWVVCWIHPAEAQGGQGSWPDCAALPGDLGSNTSTALDLWPGISTSSGKGTPGTLGCGWEGWLAVTLDLGSGPQQRRGQGSAFHM